ncbi:MAG: phosphorylase [Cyanobacteria bacterium SID2]|nr:phosphorylase [Cyanobacteria bacterium SID2]
MNLDVIFVPQGIEYKTVRRALNPPDRRLVVAIPVGIEPVRQFLQTWKAQNPQVSRVLVMGLGGSLSSQFPVGAGTLCRECITIDGSMVSSDLGWIRSSQPHLDLPLTRVCTVEQPVDRAEAKRQLHQATQADLVDMEGMAVFEAFPTAAMVRVVSDGCDRDLPDLSNTLDATGTLKPRSLALAFLRRPLPAFHLIRGSIAALRTLSTLSRSLQLLQ